MTTFVRPLLSLLCVLFSASCSISVRAPAESPGQSSDAQQRETLEARLARESGPYFEVKVCKSNDVLTVAPEGAAEATASCSIRYCTTVPPQADRPATHLHSTTIEVKTADRTVHWSCATHKEAHGPGTDEMPGGGKVCREYAAMGLSVLVYSPATTIIQDIKVTASEGDHSEELIASPDLGDPASAKPQGQVYHGAIERPGTYTIKVTATGFKPFVRERVEVKKADECHVATTQISAELEKL